ncbi:hypothetical protein EUGRSUZ_G03161 [Eucalyptus grandis]|uniref:Uncharacterized protein n=2 Tax=Eucalyptus grandis TaxID=71139 RepID=A0ACC3K8T3_EUCGR|nr:hypothetical protein EUGRSUZ_G03161 [Eucalyptus grandis]
MDPKDLTLSKTSTAKYWTGLSAISLMELLFLPSVCFCNNSTSICRKQEREALLQLRRSLVDPSGLLSSWEGKDCCRWEGVICDRVYGHVISLQLLPQPTKDETSTYFRMGPKLLQASGELNSSLLHLKYLNHLDLSGIDSNHGRIPEFIGSIKQLRYLNLLFANFHGTVPQQLGNLTKLEVLDLGNEDENLVVDDILWVSHLRSLKYLDMSGLMIAKERVPMQVTSMLPALLHLSLSGCGLHNFHMSSNHFANSTSLHLDLSWNSFNSSIPMWFYNSLESLEICENHLKGALPNWLEHFTNLKSIMLSSNFFSCPIPSVIGSLSNLETLDLSDNGLNGTIPSSIGKLSSLRSLDLSYNELVGHIPKSLGKLGALQELLLYNNHLEGVITEIHFSNLSRLKEYSINGNNNLSFKAKPSWIPPFQLEIIGMSSCKFEVEVPRWIQTQLDLSYNQITGPLPNMSTNCSFLDLSHNLISGSLLTNISTMYQVRILYLNDNLIDGTLPSSLCNLELIVLNLANNSLSGSILDCWKDSLSLLTLSFNKLSGVIPSSLGSLPHLTTLHLNRNRLNGELPQALQYCTSLVIIDLGENNLSGSIPTWFDGTFHSLLILRLRENRFVGSIPPQLCSLSRLRILDMAMNNLTGMIPHCLGNMSSMINLNQTNSFGSVAIAHSSSLSLLMGRYYSPVLTLVTLLLLKGRYNEYTKIVLQLVVNLDLSSNFLNGSIPEELSFLSRLHGLNLSHNHLSGNIPIGIGNMTSLESLDLSNNHLSGTIPQGISALTSLAHLNLSQNDLMGQIPKGNQIQTLDDPSIYAGNPLLCGDLLRKKCLSTETPQPQKVPHPKDTHEEDKLDRTLFYAVIMLGFAIGFWGFFGVLQFKKDWRRAYFSFADQAAHKAYVTIVVKVVKLKRLRLSRSR